MSEFITTTMDGEAAGDWPAIHSSEARQISLQQIRFWKGVLLPALAKDTGNSVAWWENKLKLEVMPDDFQPKTVNVDGYVFYYLPSVNVLSIKKTNQLIEGSVEYLRNNGFTWVQLPDSELRKK